MATRITGDTYPVKDQLKALGGRWNAAAKCWEVPDDKAEAAWALVGGKSAAKAMPGGPAAAPALPAAKAPAAPELVKGYGSLTEADRVGEFRGMPAFVFAQAYDCRVAAFGAEVGGRALMYNLNPPSAYNRGEGRGAYIEWFDGKATQSEVVSPEETAALETVFAAAKARHAAVKAETEAAEAARREADRVVREAANVAWAAECRAKDRWPVSQGEGYGGRPYAAGATFRPSPGEVARGYPEYLTVVSASQRYYREDGMSFGVGDESGYIYSATCRAATPAEIAPLVERAEAAARRKQARADLDAVAADVRARGESPAGPVVPEGDEVPAGGGERIYGGGRWFVLGADWVWFVQNNGHDGDDWSCNNVRTGGAGAIGWRVPADPELAARIRSLSALAYPKD